MYALFFKTPSMKDKIDDLTQLPSPFLKNSHHDLGCISMTMMKLLFKIKTSKNDRFHDRTGHSMPIYETFMSQFWMFKLDLDL
jgi:hypothetical protein